MKIGLLLPSVLASSAYAPGRIFAPLPVAVDLANGLVDKGHTVFFYTAADVKTKATIVPGDMELIAEKLSYYQFRNRDESEQKHTTTEIIKRDFENELTTRAYEDAQAGKIDIVHSYHDFSAHYFDTLTHMPTVYTLHNPLPQSKDTIEYERFKLFQNHNYVSISNNQRRSVLNLHFVATVYHGIAVTDFAFAQKPEERVIYLGRLLEDKGADIAITVARQAGLPLHIATSLDGSNRSGEYFDEKIKPFVDEEHVVMEGFMEHAALGEFIGAGKAFVFPLQWEEPFGLVMVESMACGTPVVVYNRGSAAEIVKDGVTGFIVDPDDTDRPGKGSWIIKKQGIDGLVEAVRRIGEIDRAACRKHVEENFTIEKMVSGYEDVYKKILNP